MTDISKENTKLIEQRLKVAFPRLSEDELRTEYIWAWLYEGGGIRGVVWSGRGWDYGSKFEHLDHIELAMIRWPNDKPTWLGYGQRGNLSSAEVAMIKPYLEFRELDGKGGNCVKEWQIWTLKPEHKALALPHYAKAWDRQIAIKEAELYQIKRMRDDGLFPLQTIIVTHNNTPTITPSDDGTEAK